MRRPSRGRATLGSVLDLTGRTLLPDSGDFGAGWRAFRGNVRIRRRAGITGEGVGGGEVPGGAEGALYIRGNVRGAGEMGRGAREIGGLAPFVLRRKAGIISNLLPVPSKTVKAAPVNRRYVM